MSYDVVGAMIAGTVLANGTAFGDPVVQYSLVGLIAWMVIRECFSLMRLVLDRKTKRNGYVEHHELVRIRLELETLQQRMAKLEDK